ncbi:hypothetical protein AAG570_005183 [Ranatra chinensis]|uniref:Mpv17-like protein 2 n=1 Tax=Ranatra chinensis TaxID=642074 RepID=A0ABD0XZS4_9HEMI
MDSTTTQTVPLKVARNWFGPTKLEQETTGHGLAAISSRIYIAVSFCVRYLGLYIDNRTMRNPHTRLTVLNRKYGLLRNLLQRTPKLSLDNELTIYNMILKPTWTLGIELWGPARESNIHRIQSVQSKIPSYDPRCSLGMFRELWRAAKTSGRKLIDSLYGRHLLVTNTVTSGAFMVAGDLIAQLIEANNPKWEGFDKNRSANMGIVGLVLGPIQHGMYNMLEHVYPLKTASHVIKKLAVDQFINSPFTISIILFGLDMLEGRTVEESVDEYKKKFWSLYLMDCLLSTPSQAINFRFCPPKYRVLYVNAFTIIYNVLLSGLKFNYDVP